MFYACSTCSNDFRVWSPCEEFLSLEQIALRKRLLCPHKVQNHLYLKNTRTTRTSPFSQCNQRHINLTYRTRLRTT